MKTQIDAIRAYTIIEGLDRAYGILTILQSVDDIKVAAQLASTAQNEIATALGQANGMRKEANDAHQELWNKLIPGFISTAHIYAESDKSKSFQQGCRFIEIEPEIIPSKADENDMFSWLRGDIKKRRFILDMQHDKFSTFEELKDWCKSKGDNPESIKLSCDTFLPDADRAAMIENGWPLRHATIRDHLINAAQMWVRIDEKLAHPE